MNSTLDLDDYRGLVALDEPFLAPPPARAEEVPHLVEHLLAELQAATPRGAFALRRGLSEELRPRDLLKALLTVRQPEPFLPSAFHTSMDRLLQFERQARGSTEALELPTVADVFPHTRFTSAALWSLWQGDISTLRVDAIVNAANAALLGCFEPFHACIDNVIHSAAGPRLREDCQRIMSLQGSSEATGAAKITRGYNLPAAYVLHTVGPIYRQHDPEPPAPAREALASSYHACLEMAGRIPAIRTVAFCCISTGVFGFPQQPAARVALHTVDRWMTAHPGALDRVIFNVFRSDDLAIYQSLLAGAP
jgi:O-acetyl-ADP-ribose deacetylase (regulator of RNase III)